MKPTLCNKYSQTFTLKNKWGLCFEEKQVSPSLDAALCLPVWLLTSVAAHTGPELEHSIQVYP